jgi:dolichol-phosphate mannosyltransferase
MSRLHDVDHHLRPVFDLVIPLYNEADNIEALVADLVAAGLPTAGLATALLVDNGSEDDTAGVIDRLATTHPWIRPLHVSENRGYGGGIRHGLDQSTAPYLAYIPGDRQVSAADLRVVWEETLRLHADPDSPPLFVKGWRQQRHDGRSMRVVSRAYTLLSNLVLGLQVRDVNALPKCFDRRLLAALPTDSYRSFTFEAQVLLCARRHGFQIHEVPVVFHARREGVSSWSGKRLQTYWRTFWQMYLLRATVLGQRIPLERFARRWA